MVTSSRVTVGDTATLIATGQTAAQAAQVSGDPEGGNWVKIRDPAGGNTIDLGDSSVTDGTGYELEAGETYEFYLNPGETIYGIAASAVTQEIHVIEYGR